MQEFWPDRQDLAAHGFNNAVYGLEQYSLPREEYQPGRLSLNGIDTDDTINTSNTDTFETK